MSEPALCGHCGDLAVYEAQVPPIGPLLVCDRHAQHMKSELDAELIEI